MMKIAHIGLFFWVSVYGRSLKKFRQCMTDSEGLAVEYRGDDKEKFDDNKLSWNIRHVWTPDAIVWASDAEEVSKAVKCAQQSNHKVTARSGGHSYEGLATGGQDGMIMIDVGKIQHVNFNRGESSAWVGPGIRLGKLYFNLWDQGRFWFPPGLCPTLGLAGFALGGGVGFWSRKWGLASDHVEGMQAVLADGTIANISSTEHPDLFWALRGSGGGNFAVVTDFKLHVEEAPEMVTVVVFGWKPEDMSEVVCKMVEVADQADLDVGWELILYKNKAELWITLLDPTDSKKQDLEKVLAKLPTPATKRTNDLDFFTAYLNVSDRLHASPTAADLDFPEDFRNPHKHSKKKSLLVPRGTILKKEVCDKLADRMPSVHPDGLVMFELYGGEVDAIKPTDTAYVHRKSIITLSMAIITDNAIPDEDIRWLQGTFDLLRPHTSDRCYQNYVDLELSDWAEAYYGENLPRLKRIQLDYDPDGLFDKPQAITRVSDSIASSHEL